MKILFFSSYYYPHISGLTIYPFRIINYLSNKNQVTVLTFNHQNNNLKILKIKNRKLKIVYLPYLFRFLKGFISPQSFFYFFEELKKNNLLILNQPNVEGFFLAILARIFNKKIFSIVHCFLYEEKNIFKKIVFNFTNLIVFLQLLVSEKIFFYSKDYLKSTWFYKFLKNRKIYYQLPPIKKFKIDKRFFRKILEYKKENKFLIGFSGRIAQEKGLEYLINALKNRSFSFSSFMLLFAGPYGNKVVGEYSYFIKIKNLLDKNNINYNFLGKLRENQLGSFYKAIDLLVLPSINSTEAFGMVQAEAMILGTPTIASNLPGVNIPIKLTKMGILVKPKNEKQLTRAILEILKNRKKYTNKKLILNAQKIFDINKVYNFWEEVINEKN